MSDQDKHVNVTRGPNGEIVVQVKQTAIDAIELAQQGFTAAEAKAIIDVKRQKYNYVDEPRQTDHNHTLITGDGTEYHLKYPPIVDEEKLVISFDPREPKPLKVFNFIDKEEERDAEQ